MKPFVTVITPVKDEIEYIKECIDSVKNLTYPKDSYEHIVIIDKNSKYKGKIKKLKSGNTKIFESGKIGSAANRNFGVTKANKKAKYFAFTDADCIVDKNWLDMLVDKLESSPKNIGCVGGVNLVPFSDKSMAHLIGAVENTLLGGGGSAQSTVAKKEREVPSIPNCNAVYRKELWVKNKQDETLIVGQDGEFNYRLWKQGSKFIIIPNAIVFHHRSGSIKGHIKRMFKYGQATRRIFSKHSGILKTRWYSLGPIGLVAGIIALSLLGLWKSLFWCVLGYAILLYLIIVLLTTIAVTINRRTILGFLTPIILISQHLAYGIGFIIG